VRRIAAIASRTFTNFYANDVASAALLSPRSLTALVQQRWLQMWSANTDNIQFIRNLPLNQLQEIHGFAMTPLLPRTLTITDLLAPFQATNITTPNLPQAASSTGYTRAKAEENYRTWQQEYPDKQWAGESFLGRKMNAAKDNDLFWSGLTVRNMILGWQVASKIHFQSYYEASAVSQCTYTETQRGLSTVTLVSLLLGAVGGLNVGARLLVRAGATAAQAIAAKRGV